MGILQGLSVIAEQWFIASLTIAMLWFLIRRDTYNTKVVLALLVPLSAGLILRDLMWNHSIFWNFGYGMLSIFTLWCFAYFQLKLPNIDKRLWMIGLFLFLGVVINYARHLDRVNNTYFVRPIYFAWANASNIGVVFWVYLPIIKGLLKYIKGKASGRLNFTYFQR